MFHMKQVVREHGHTLLDLVPPRVIWGRVQKRSISIFRHIERRRHIYRFNLKGSSYFLPVIQAAGKFLRVPYTSAVIKVSPIFPVCYYPFP